MHLHADTRSTQRLQGLQGNCHGRDIRNHGIGIGHQRPAALTLRLDQLKHTLQTHTPADSRGRLATEQFKQAIVSTTTAQGALGAELVGQKFKDGVTVVIQTAHQSGVDTPAHAASRQQGLDGIKMR